MKNLKHARIQKKKTQKDVAILLDVVESCYANWEQGRTEPDTITIRKLCLIFDVTADYLLGLEDEYGARNKDTLMTTDIKIIKSFNNFNGN